jgi:hypothetical protein
MGKRSCPNYLPIMSQNEPSIACVELALRDPNYPDLAEAFGYWEEKRGARFAPARGDIEPLDLVQVLPRVMLADVTYDPVEFRYRLSGTGIARIHGAEPTGLRPRDLEPAEYGALIDRHYRQCVAERRPLLHLIILDATHRSRAYARLLLPLSNDGEHVNMLMAIDSANQDARELKNYFARYVAPKGAPKS